MRAVRICAVNGLYPRRHANFAKAVTATIPADALPVGAETVRVTPLDSYGNCGRALEAKICFVVRPTECYGRKGRAIVSDLYEM